MGRGWAGDKSGGRGQRRGPQERGLWTWPWWTTRVRDGVTPLFSRSTMSRSRKDHEEQKGTWPRLPVPDLLLFLFVMVELGVSQSLVSAFFIMGRKVCEEGIKMDRVKRDSHNHDTRTLLFNFQRSVGKANKDAGAGLAVCVWSGRLEMETTLCWVEKWLDEEVDRAEQSLTGWRETREKRGLEKGRRLQPTSKSEQESRQRPIE